MGASWFTEISRRRDEMALHLDADPLSGYATAVLWRIRKLDAIVANGTTGREEKAMRRITHVVVATKLHGGGILSRHYSEAAAERAAARWRMAACTCGCCGVVAIKDLASVPGDSARLDSTVSPYALVR